MTLRIGSPIPSAYLARLSPQGSIEVANTDTLFAAGRLLVIGVPGAFTPVCTRQHLPDFIAKADLIRASGYDRICCIASSDPYSLAAWTAQIDPLAKLDFFSDGNLAFARACKMNTREDAMFLGERSRRFVLDVKEGLLRRIRVEPDLLSVSCTRASEVVTLEI